MRTEDSWSGSPDRACSSGLPPPLVSSRAFGWDGVVAELRCTGNLDVVLPYPDHVIAVILGGGGDLWQSRGGHQVQRSVRPGDVIITCAGEPKRWRHLDDMITVVLRLSRSYLDRLAAEQGRRHPPGVEIKDVPSVRDAFLQELAMRFLKALEPESAASRSDIHHLARSLGTHLIARYAAQSTRAAPRFRTMSSAKLQRAIDYIEANLDHELCVSRIAEQVAMSESYFSHVFRQTVGLPPHQYLRNRRIERAKALLREGDMPLSEIAQRVGCSSASNFSVLFHRATGTTPGMYRNRC